MFSRLEEKEPDHFAVKQYKKYKLAAGAADYQDIFIPGILWVLWAVRHHQPLRLGQ